MKVAELLDLSGRVALVTGGSRGLGLAMAAALGEMGARVALTARQALELAAARAALEREGIEAATFEHDLSRAETAAPLVAAVVDRFGPIDILVNNAGTGWGAPAEDHPLDAWRRVIDCNLTGTFELTRQVALACMIPRHYGRIINIASVAGLMGSVGEFKAVAYTASKGALIAITRQLAGEWGVHGIAVNAICPGFIPSKMSRGLLQVIGDDLIAATPLRQLGTEDDLKALVVLLAGAGARHITGQSFAVDGGVTAM